MEKNVCPHRGYNLGPTTSPNATAELFVYTITIYLKTIHF